MLKSNRATRNEPLNLGMSEQDQVTTTTSWLRPQRLRRQALLLATALWLGYALTIATPGMRDRFGHLKGADFLHPYVLGTLALEHRGDALYDTRVQREVGEERVPESAGDWFLPVYGPQYSLIWMPLALLPYGWAASVWLTLSAAIYAACCYAVWRSCANLHDYGTTVALAAAAFPGFFALITFGQNSALALAALTGTYFALRARHEVLAGVCLGLLAYKPQLGIVPACVFVIAAFWPRRVDRAPSGSAGSFGDRKAVGASGGNFSLAGMRDRSPWKVIVGAVASVIAQFALAWAWYGSGPLRDYLHVLTHVNSAAGILEPRPYFLHSLRGFWNLLLPWPRLAFVLYILTAIATLAVAIACWRSRASLSNRWAIILLATVLVAPHLTVYDLVIVAPALLWIADWLAVHAARGIAGLVYLSFILPFAGPLTRWTHAQLSVIALAGLTVTFALRLREEQ